MAGSESGSGGTPFQKPGQCVRAERNYPVRQASGAHARGVRYLPRQTSTTMKAVPFTGDDLDGSLAVKTIVYYLISIVYTYRHARSSAIGNVCEVVQPSA